MRRVYLLILFFAGLLLAIPVAEGAEPLLKAQAYWIDQTGAAGLETVQSAPFQPYAGAVARGYSRDVLWLRITVAGQDDLEPLALIVRPAFLKRIELYLPGPDGVPFPVPIVSGRDAVNGPANHIGMDNGFIVSPSKAPRDLFLRISTTTSLTADVELKTLREAESSSHLLWAGLAIYVAFLLAVCLWGVVNWGVKNDLMYGLFALRQFYSIVVAVVLLGPLRFFFADTWSAASREVIYNLVLTTVVLSIGSFDLRLISEFNPPRRLRQCAQLLLLTPLVFWALLWLGQTQRALFLNAVSVLLSSVGMAVLAFTTKEREAGPQGNVSRAVLRTGYMLIAVTMIVPSLVFHSFMSRGGSVINLVFLQAIISTVVLVAILSIRSRQRDLKAQWSILHYQAKEQELRRENMRRLEKERFLSMLTHELRNPLAVIRLEANAGTSGGKAVQRATLEMARIIERVEQSERVEDGEIQVRKTTFDLARFLDDLLRDHPSAASLTLATPEGLVVTTDEGLLRSILRNLLDNARKYGRRGGAIKLGVTECERGGNSLTLEVINEVGEAGAPDAGKLFTKYYRGKGAQRQPGSGLGLFLVAHWVRALGGKVDYVFRDGRDGPPAVSFRVELPQ